MPRDVNGNTQPLPGTIVSTGDTILPSQHNPAMVDLYAMMAQSLSRDGQGGMRAPLNMSGFRVQNVGSATADTDAVSLGQSRNNGVPVGATMDYAGTTAPATWSLCYGQAVSRTEYSDLFSAIGTTYGAGDGSSTFNLPDCRGRVVAGKDNMGGTSADRLTAPINGDVLGVSGGSQSHTLTTAEIPSHNHGISDPGHSHGAGYAISGLAGSNARSPSDALDNTSATTVATTGISILNSGGGGAHNNIQPTIIMNKIIKVSY